MSSSANTDGKSVVLDQLKAEAFAGRMLDILNGSQPGKVSPTIQEFHLLEINKVSDILRNVGDKR